MKIKRHKNLVVLVSLVSLLVLLKLVAGSGTLTRAQTPTQTKDKPTGSVYGVSYGDDLPPSMIDSRQTLPPTPVPGQLSEGPQVIRLTYADIRAKPDEAQTSLDRLAAWLDIWHVDPDTRTLTALVWPEEYAALVDAGYHVEVDAQRTIQILAPPGYPCYRTVEELYATLAQTITLNYPGITELVVYGDSWEKTLPGGADGYELYALEITNKAIPGPKPVAVINGGMHAMELAPPEVAMALIKYLTTNYGYDPDVTWLLDYHKIIILPMLNPDGHKKAEIGQLWRKNTDNDDGCNDPGRWGTDLNRNFYFKWGCCGGSSADPCQSTYRGPSPDSEPEIYHYEDFVRSRIPDQWDYSDTLTVPAPVTTTGILVDLHSYDPSILYPWGWTEANAPNDTDLKAIAEKYGSLSGYPVKRRLFRVDGMTRDWGYGDLGIPTFTVELGTDNFQNCNDLPGIVADNLPALFYFIRIARTPYMLVHGPDVSNITLTPSATVTAPPVQLSATISDAQNGGQAIAAAVYYIDVPPWVTTTATISYPMTAIDGTFDAAVEEVQAELDIHNLSSGRHTIFIQGQDADGNWGPLWATWLTVTQAWLTGDVVDDQTGAAINAAHLHMVSPPWSYTARTDSSGKFARELVSGTYSVTATAQGYYSTTVENVVTQSGKTTSLHIRMDALPVTHNYLPIIVKKFVTLP